MTQIGVFALEVVLLTALSTLAVARLRSVRYRVIIWQAALVTTVLLGVAELSGASRSLFFGGPIKDGGGDDPNTPRLRADFVSNVRSRLATSAGTELEPVAKLQSTGAITPISPPAAEDPDPDKASGFISSPLTDSANTYGGLGLAIWFAGTLLLLMRVLGVRLVLWFVFGRRPVVSDPELITKISRVSAALGLKRKVRLVVSTQLAAPIVFGIVRPTVVVPRDFPERPEMHEVILAHELAHVLAGDPGWHLLADLVSALLWWHPASWWIRRRLLVESETAADEASVVVREGPKRLAECLVSLGRLVSAKRAPLAMGMTGFRSHLGRRVERLLGLPDTTWVRPSRRSGWLMRAAGPVLLGGVAVLGTAQLSPLENQLENPMTTMKTCWSRSLAAVTMLVTLNATAAEPPTHEAQPVGTPAATPTAESAHRPARSPQPRAGGGNAGFDRILAERYGLVGMARNPDIPGPTQLETKLEAIRFDEVEFDGLPLSEVLKILAERARREDPEEKGVNFLINPNPPPTPLGVDPTTGQPIAMPMEHFEVENVSIRFNLALHHVRLRDVLDAIVKVASQPITYTVEEYAVVFSSATPEPGNTPLGGMGMMGGYGSGVMTGLGGYASGTPLMVSTFRIEKEALITGLGNAFDVNLRHEDSKEPAPLWEPRQVQDALKQLLVRLGIEMEVAGKSVFYNQLNGVLMVRATAEDLDVVRAAVETLGGESGSSGASTTRAGR
jgi:beta-lactamase regulating signal transducer with metallopeptidase domain